MSEVAQSCPTLCDPMDCRLPGFSAHGILQARKLEWVAISFSRGSSKPRHRTQVSHVAGRCFTLWANNHNKRMKFALIQVTVHYMHCLMESSQQLVRKTSWHFHYVHLQWLLLEVRSPWCPSPPQNLQWLVFEVFAHQFTHPSLKCSITFSFFLSKHLEGLEYTWNWTPFCHQSPGTLNPYAFDPHWTQVLWEWGRNYLQLPLIGVYLLYSVVLGSATKWISYMCTDIPSFLDFLSI